jgi:transcriptional antiterminator NusG
VQWFAIQVTARHENKVRAYLEKRRSDGLADVIGRVIVPEKDGVLIAPGYVFVESAVWPDPYLRMASTRCRTLGTVTEEEIMRLLSAPAEPPVRKGDRVRVVGGPLEGQEGTVLSSSGRRRRWASPSSTRK